MLPLQKAASGACHLKSRQAFVAPGSISKVIETADMLLAIVYAKVRIRQNDEVGPFIAYWHNIRQSRATARFNLSELELREVRHAGLIQFGGKMNF
jgi:hypothetical protein